MSFSNFSRFGRKKTICCGLFFSAVGAFGSVLLTLFDDGKSTGGYVLFLCTRIDKYFFSLNHYTTSFYLFQQKETEQHLHSNYNYCLSGYKGILENYEPFFFEKCPCLKTRRGKVVIFIANLCMN